MANPIPPLVSDSPPPLDFDEPSFDDDDLDPDSNSLHESGFSPTPSDIYDSPQNFDQSSMDPKLPNEIIKDIINSPVHSSIITKSSVKDEKSGIESVPPVLLEDCDESDVECNEDNRSSEVVTDPTDDNYFKIIPICSASTDSSPPSDSNSIILNGKSIMVESLHKIESNNEFIQVDPPTVDNENTNDFGSFNSAVEEYPDISSSNNVSQNDNIRDSLTESTEAHIQCNNSNDDSLTFSDIITPIVKTITVADVTDTKNEVDDSFDDFCEFKAFETNQTTISDCQPFEADFSAFTNVPESIVQSFPATVDTQPVEIDDEFGEFSEYCDFSPDPPIPNQSVPELNSLDLSKAKEKVEDTLRIMFNSNGTLEVNESDVMYCTNAGLKRDKNLVKLMSEFENLETVSHSHWKKSTSKNNLIKSVGLDPDNILYCPMWNSRVPRFAANLSSAPLEPLKPISVDQNTKDTTSTVGNTLANPETTTAQFDWNVTGLENPLDANSMLLELEKLVVMENLNMFRNNKSTNPILHTSIDCPLTHELDQSLIIDNESDCTINSTLSFEHQFFSSSNDTSVSWAPSSSKLDVEHLDEKEITVVKDTEPDTFISTSCVVSANGGLKETYIFTPTKSVDMSNVKLNSSGSATVVKEEKSQTPVLDYDFEKAAAGIIIDETVIKKEYHDVVYSLSDDTEVLQPQMGVMSLTTKPNNQNQIAPDPNDKYSPFHSLRNDGGGLILNPSDMKDLLDKPSVFDAPSILKNPVNSSIIAEQSLEKKNESDDEFSEFQSVPIGISNNQLNTISGAIAPSPIVPQHTFVDKTNISLKNSDLNFFESDIFTIPTSSTAQVSTDFNEFTSFASAPPIQQNSQLQATNVANNSDDDWSDFVSSDTNTNNLSSNGPNFTSWNPPQYQSPFDSLVSISSYGNSNRLRPTPVSTTLHQNNDIHSIIAPEPVFQKSKQTTASFILRK